MVIKVKKSICGILILLMISIFVPSYATVRPLLLETVRPLLLETAKPLPLEGKVICIDPGHPSEVSAGSGKQNGTTEVLMNWEVALKLKKTLEEKYGATVVMTKSKISEKVTNKRRAEIANEAKADVAIRLHCDSETSGKKRGIAVFYPDKQGTVKNGTKGPSKVVIKESALIAQAIGKEFELIKKELPNNGVKTDADTYIGSQQGALTGSIYSQVPVALIEMVFLSNAKDAEFIKKGINQQRLADIFAKGISTYLNKAIELKTAKQTNAEMPKEIKLDQAIENIAKKHGLKQYGIYAKSLKDGSYIGVNEDLTRKDKAHNNRLEASFYGASIIKLFEAYVVSDMLSKGELKIEKPILDSLTNKTFNWQTMLKRMIIVSDNDAFNVILREVGIKTINERLVKLGIIDTKIYAELLPTGSMDYQKTQKRNQQIYGYDRRGGNLTAKEVGYVLEQIYIRKAKEPYMNELHQMLLDCTTGENRIKKGIAKSTTVAHKTGSASQEGVYSDAGIVYKKDAPFILVILTEGTTQSKGESFISEVTNLIQNEIR